MLKKSVSCILIAFLLFFPVILAQQVVQVQTTPPPEEKSFFATYFGFLKSPIFWWIMFGFLMFLLFLVGIFFLVRWAIKFFKERNDLFWKLKSERIKLAKIQRRYPSNSWFKVHKNTPIRLVRNEEGRISISQPIAYHRGDYMTHEGNVVIAMNLKDNNRFFFFPITSLLVIPNKEKVEVTVRGQDGKSKTITIDNLPQAKDIVNFNMDEILIFAESLSSVGMFYVPVLRAKDGKIIDLSLPTYQSLKDVALGEFLYDQTSDFVGIAKKSISLNPHLAYEIKSNDANSNVEVPSSSGSR